METFQSKGELFGEQYLVNIFNNLSVLRIDGRFCDIELIAGSTKIKAHRVVLAASCAYFDAMFHAGLEDSERNQINLPTIPADILPMIVEFIYKGKTDINKSTVQDLLIAADMLQLKELVNICGEFLEKDLHPSNVLGIFRFAKAHNCLKLAQKALEFAESNWSKLVYEEEFLELPLSELLLFLTSEKLKIDSEEQVLKPALTWLEHDADERRRHCFDVLYYIRLPLISPSVLDCTTKNIKDGSIALALRTVRSDMKLRRGALVQLEAEPRFSSRRSLYVVGGSSRGSSEQLPLAPDRILSSVLKFDMHKREWTELAPMSIARIQPGIATLGGLLYAVGGEQGSQILANGEVYDPQINKWSDIAPMNEARCEFGLTALNGHLYAFGGWVGSDMGGTIEVYNPVTNEWTLKGHMREPRFAMGIITYKGYIYLVGGCTHQRRHTRDLLRYSAERGEWRALAGMRRARSQAAAAVLDGRLYVVGGNAPRCAALKSVEIYDFDTDTWTEAQEMGSGRAACCAGAAGGAGGALVVAGGDCESAGERAFYRARTPLRSVELCDPRTRRWAPGPPLPYPRAEAGSALL